MPNGRTFTILPIKKLIEKYCTGVVVDPFANGSKYGTLTNDLNPEMETTHHMDGLEFLKTIPSSYADVVLYDPPYSITQASQLYKQYGKEKLQQSVSNMGYWASCKDQVQRILKPAGVCIICGWSSNGLGKGRGFELIEILLVPHGGSKNDTICTVEKKKII